MRSNGEVEWSEGDESAADRRKTILPPPIKPPNGELLSSISGMRQRIADTFREARGESEPPKRSSAA